MISEQEARLIGKQVFLNYSANGQVDGFKLIKDGQKLLGYDYTPTQEEVSSYGSNILDANKDKSITQEDFEALAIKYLCNKIDLKAQVTQVQQQEEPVKRYSKAVEQRLDVARRLFKKFDRDQSGVISRDEVPQLLEDTYRELGMNQKVSKQDIDDWMNLNDVNKDGQVTLQEYEQVILQSLKKAGISLD
ncbi:EF-hand pair protein (macronuclear) [Tetrahymena thermophila SB210]|uniref:EF-hand pair protein n=1 Tax=Tetrahymena thermophila (strain SB210) TaxID=312017 RepID=Q24HN9_TETTS|nr:EF-hand pair protein [Tetrahymena thermophila SB210]EAS07272.1 EF-hand pair protein [Tetrahymena thermophila SB210]|eukprot:XP_001027514.1 EF-hand pair protein [Tetrahymena thermophila SB210]